MFEFKTSLDEIPGDVLAIYFIVVIISGLVLFFNNKKEPFIILLLLLFYESVFNYLGSISLNIQKIAVFVLALYFFRKAFSTKLISKNDIFLIIALVIFTLSFVISIIFHPVSFNFGFSQYFKYFLPVVIIIAFNHAVLRGIQIEKYYNLLLVLFKLQIAYSILKIFLIGFNEAVIGSVSLRAGSVATVLPILGFLIIWVANEKKFSKKEWVFTILLIIIAVASNKRAIWFILPIFIAYFYFFLGKRISLSKTIIVLMVAPLIFYFGVRFNPTLNKEGKIWGSFDLEYVFDYTDYYTTGGDRHRNTTVGYGRIGGNQVLLEEISKSPYELSSMFGHGLDQIYGTTYEEFDEDKYNLASKGATSGMGRFIIANGYLGALGLILIALAFCYYIPELKIRLIMILFFIFDFYFYAGILFNSRTISVLFVISIILIRHRQYITKKLYVNNNDENSEFI